MSGILQALLASIVAADKFELYAWGGNSYGKLGLGNTTNVSSPVQVGALVDWSSAKGGVYSSGALKTDGTLWSWGDNSNGQLGINSTISKSSPVQIGALTNWYDFSVANSRNMSAIKEDGTLWIWGQNYNGTLGQNTEGGRVSSPIQVGSSTDWALVTMGDANVGAIKTDGTLWTWGLNSFGALGQNLNDLGNGNKRSSPTQVGILTNWANIGMAEFNSVATKTDGTLWAWGRGTFGAVGDGFAVNRSSPVQIGAMTDWSKPQRENFGPNGAAIKTSGTLWVWGDNSQGQLLQNNTIAKSSPIQVGSLTNWSTVSIGVNSIIALKTDGTLWVGGGNTYGQLGLDSQNNVSSPVQLGSSSNWAHASNGRNHAFAVIKV